jgi:DNA-binding PadR family transcriptional regulator
MSRSGSVGDLELLILLALIRLGPEAYGVSIAREIEEKRKRPVALGSIYAALDRLHAKGFVTSTLGEATPERGGRAKRYFRVTAAGLREARAIRQALIGMWQGIPELEGGRA